MARCSSCNKFVSFDESEPEVNNLEVDEDGHVTAEVRIVNACAECGEELTEANLEAEADHADEVAKHREEMAGRKPLSEAERLLEPGCPPHVIGTACAVCGWDGKELPSKVEVRVHRYNPPKVQDYEQGGKEKVRHLMAEVTKRDPSSCGYESWEWTTEKDGRKDEKKIEAEIAAALAEARPMSERVPRHRVAKYAPDPSVHDLEIEETSSERTSRAEGKGRGTRTFYGAFVDYTVTCSCGGEWKVEGSLEVEEQASAMESLV